MRTLQHLVNDTARHVPFYRSHWASAGVDVERLSLPRDFERLPVVRKRDLLAAGVQARLDDRRRLADLVSDTTSGSSGQPFEIFVDRSAMRWRRLRFLRALVGAGYRPGERLMLVAHRHATSIGARLLGWRYASLKQGESALAAEYLRTRPAVLYGPLSSLLALADRLTIAHDGHPRPRLVVTTAEELTAAQRRTLDRAFGARIADFYGMTELGLVAWREGCEAPYRLPATNLKLEFLPCAADDTLERLVVTDLSGGAMPLVRYETGDLVRRDHSLPGAPIVRITGREIDCLRLPGGGRVSPYRITTTLEVLEGVDQYEVVQNRDLSVEVFIRTVGAADAAPIFERARQAVNHVCDGALPLEVKAMAARDGTGRKLRPVRCLAGETA
jgi:phenylacetate-CoA ligase